MDMAQDLEAGLRRALVKVEAQARKDLSVVAETVAADARAAAPVDTGRLRDSIAARTTPGGAEVVVGAEYAGYVEFGTQDTSAEPFLRPALHKAPARAKVTFGSRRL